MARPTGALVAAVLLGTAVTSGCSLIGGGETADGGGAVDSDRVVLVTHESFVLPESLTRRFEEESGLTLLVRPSGDAGTLTNKLVLTQGSPTGDVAFGVDNTFASRALDAGVFVPHEVDLPDGAEEYQLSGDAAGDLAPIDNGNVCVNIDETWFAENEVAPPEMLEDLTEPEYAGLLAVPGASTSSVGMAFLLATIAAYGEDWQDYWTRLMANGAVLTDGWSDAYQVRFTQGGGDGDLPMVVSYDSSPAFTVDGDRSTTRALLGTCFEQVEYAGVLAGADNPEGARELISFLLSPEVQAALPESMYVFPVVSGIELPADWARYAEQPTAPFSIDPEQVTTNRDDWLRAWSDITTR